MHTWVWPILIALGQGVTVYGLMFLHKLIQVVAGILEAHIELMLKQSQNEPPPSSAQAP